MSEDGMSWERKLEPITFAAELLKRSQYGLTKSEQI